RTSPVPYPTLFRPLRDHRSPPTRSIMNAIPATATARESAAPGAGAPQRLLQRLILPHESSPDIVPLYIESADARSGATGSALGLGGGTEHTPRAETESHSTQRSAQAQVDISELDKRHSV